MPSEKSHYDRLFVTRALLFVVRMCVSFCFSFPRQELEGFARLALKYNLFIISDEVRVFGGAFVQREGSNYLQNLTVIERPTRLRDLDAYVPSGVPRVNHGIYEKTPLSVVLFEFGVLSDEYSHPPGCLHALLLFAKRRRILAALSDMPPPSRPGGRTGLREHDVRRNKAPQDGRRRGHVREDGHSVQRLEALRAYW